MRRRILLLAAGLLAVAAGSLVTARDGPPPDGRDADRAAVRAAAAEFVKAFAAGDAKAVAAAWTDNGELHDEGDILRGRAAIEAAYAEFFKAKPHARLEIDVQTVRFPSQDSAVEEGVMTLKLPGSDHPTTTWYSAFHVREGGRWKLAVSREWGADDHKLDDLAWLIGDWRATPPNREVALSFAWNEKKTQIRGKFTAKEGGKVTSAGTQTIGVDPATGQIHSWTFDEDGGRGEALWSRDGGRWVQDSVGVSPDGTETAAVNVFTRVNDDEFLWRSVARSVGGAAVPDTLPVKVQRVRPSPTPNKGATP